LGGGFTASFFEVEVADLDFLFGLQRVEGVLLLAERFVFLGGFLVLLLLLLGGLRPTQQGKRRAQTERQKAKQACHNDSITA